MNKSTFKVNIREDDDNGYTAETIIAEKPFSVNWTREKISDFFDRHPKMNHTHPWVQEADYNYWEETIGMDSIMVRTQNPILFIESGEVHKKGEQQITPFMSAMVREVFGEFCAGKRTMWTVKNIYIQNMDIGPDFLMKVNGVLSPFKYQYDPDWYTSELKWVNQQAEYLAREFRANYKS